MLFNSYIFVFAFLPICLLGYGLLSRLASRSIAILWLTICSLAYYGWWNPSYLALIAFSIGFNFAFGVYLGSQRSSLLRSKIVLGVGVATNLALLGYFKYTNFFLDTLNLTLGTEWETAPIVLPLAISFFTFQQIAYLVDVYKADTHEYNFLDYSLFVTFFPQLIAGPIVHHKEMLPQFSERGPYRINPTDLSVGSAMFFLGLFKKVVIADTMALHASPIFDSVSNGATAGFTDAWIAALAYTMQLYFDFSGYSDMALGTARVFGIRLPVNFFSPYKATSIVEFWRRWHITLSRFLRDYLYIPLGGNRHGRTRRYVNLFLTMLLGGLWHGAGWTFVVWGALHGIYLCINHAWSIGKSRLGLGGETGTVLRAAYVLITFIAVVIGWVFFRAASLPDATSILGSMFGVHGAGATLRSAQYEPIAMIALTLALVWCVPNTTQFMSRYRPGLGWRPFRGARGGVWKLNRLRWRPTVIYAIVIAAIGVLAIQQMSRVSEFIYYQF